MGVIVSMPKDVDYSRLNEITLGASYTMPTLEELPQAASHRNTIDLQ